MDKPVERLYHALDKIAERLDVSQDLAREWISKGWIRASRSSLSGKAPWVTNESAISEDIRQLPKRMIETPCQ